MANLFISYSRLDRPLLDNLVPHIRKVFGHDCLWFDSNLSGGADWWSTIIHEIEQCAVFVFLVSEDSLTSKYCLDEMRHAIDRGKRLLPIIVRRLSSAYPAPAPEDIAPALERTQYVDLSVGAEDTKLPELYRAIHFLLVEFQGPEEQQLVLRRQDRWILANQFAILAKLYPEEKDGYEQMREVVERGYELHYNWISEYIYKGESVMTKDECVEVLDILDMFSFLKYAYEGLADTSEVDTLWIKFAGFDGNHEAKYLGYLRYLIEREGKFAALIRSSDLNSHVPVLKLYRTMLEEWKKSADKYNLSKSDILRITFAVSRRSA